MSPRPNGFLRFFLRFPVWLYRLHLGGLMGKDFLLLHHIGRKSGQARETVIQIIRYEQDRDLCVVLSGWGSASDWLRNLQQTPDARITLGNRTLRVRAVILPEAEAAGELLDYSQHQPAAFRAISTRVVGHNIVASPESCHELAKHIPVVVFHPQ